MLGVVGLVAVVIAWRTGNRAALRVAAGALDRQRCSTRCRRSSSTCRPGSRRSSAFAVLLTVLAIVLMFSAARRPVAGHWTEGPIMIAVVTVLFAFPLGYFLRSRLAANTAYAIAYLWAFAFQTLYLILDSFGGTAKNPAFEAERVPAVRTAWSRWRSSASASGSSRPGTGLRLRRRSRRGELRADLSRLSAGSAGRWVRRRRDHASGRRPGPGSPRAPRAPGRSGSSAADRAPRSPSRRA